MKSRAAKDHGKKFRGKLAASFSDIVHYSQAPSYVKSKYERHVKTTDGHMEILI